MNKRKAQERLVTRQIRIVFKAIQAHSKQVQNICGLSGVRLWMLHEIGRSPAIKVSELANVLSIHRSTCSNMLDKLEDLELIFRKRSKTDHRAVHLHITEKGREMLAKAPSPPEGKLSSSLNQLSVEQLRALEESLGNLIEALQFEDEQAALTPIQTV
ncbi:MAG: MarR family transcriptional regulator [Deltaproteobacteria bacterium]|nr:MAG: MarR family transcriptional regulator [Deltaproteobacteria bacterium]